MWLRVIYLEILKEKRDFDMGTLCMLGVLLLYTAASKKILNTQTDNLHKWDLLVSVLT